MCVANFAVLQVLKLEEEEVKRIKNAQAGSWINGLSGMASNVFAAASLPGR